MQGTDLHFRFPAPGWRQRLDSYFAGLGQGVNAAALIRARLAEVAGLEALSDAELALLGLDRSDIPARVFQDLFPGG
ncbi:DUF1127 domain-containing protein [Marinovum sp.]|uniref:DUF1127 domain-containing protein n=1 Tax=Marinovum sp. TaxID=2024839 RepID=UPI002B26CED6|nr:DUF1127 domain-containing protein [Marinovum sp.]